MADEPRNARISDSPANFGLRRPRLDESRARASLTRFSTYPPGVAALLRDSEIYAISRRTKRIDTRANAGQRANMKRRRTQWVA